MSGPPSSLSNSQRVKPRKILFGSSAYQKSGITAARRDQILRSLGFWSMMGAAVASAVSMLG